MSTVLDRRHGELDTTTLERFRAHAAADDAANRFFTEDFDALVDAGHFLASVPADLGGGGLHLAATGQLQRALARYAPAAALASSMHLYWTGAAADLVAAGIDELSFVLDEARAGEIFASGHAEVGNDVPLLLSTTTAEPVPGGYRFTGRKLFGSLGPVWTWLGVHGMDVTDPDRPTVVHAFVRRGDPGVTVEENWDTLTMRASQSHDVVLDGVFVPTQRVGAVVPAGRSDSPFVGVVTIWALVLICNTYLGVAERAFELAVGAAQTRTSIALERATLAHNPMVQHEIAEMWIALDGARVSLDGLAEDWSSGVDHGDNWPLKVFAAKQRVTDAVTRVVDTAAAVTGGASIRTDNELSRLWRDSRGIPFHPPTAALAHELIGKAVLGIDPGAGPRW